MILKYKNDKNKKIIFIFIEIIYSNIDANRRKNCLIFSYEL